MYPQSIWYPPAPVGKGLPPLVYGRILFAYLSGMQADGRPCYGMLNAQQLDLALRASQDLLASDAHPRAIEAFANVRRRIALALEFLNAPERPAAVVPDVEPFNPRGTYTLPASPAPKPRPLAPADIAF